MLRLPIGVFRDLSVALRHNSPLSFQKPVCGVPIIDRATTKGKLSRHALADLQRREPDDLGFA